MTAKNPYEGLSDEARELCIRRMVKTLTKKPRTRQARLYRQSLVGPAETEHQLRSRARSIAERIIDACAERGEPPPQRLRVRKDRRAPMARTSMSKEHRPWNCRGACRQRWDVQGAPAREPRDMALVHSIKATLHKAQEGLCALCGDHLHSIPRRSEIDHVIPRSALGADAPGNFVLVHAPCNRLKANDVPTGCEMIWLLNVNARLGWKPDRY